ncbi:MAG TPA: ParB/RepB/Spo0J family partition protein [Nitrososphaeraceae archaeon]|nr:ParB/RepB/Spo0J family partition protein [Nitrososphaeraceae archaeon]
MSKTISSNALLGVIDDIPISKLRAPKSQLRSLAMNLDELVGSIRQRGLLQPIVVRGLEDQYYQIIAGYRRYQACKRLSWRKITCNIVELDDKGSFELSLIENIQRETLNPIDEARAFKIYISEFGWGGVSDLAKKIGKSPSYVTKRIELLDLPSEVIQSVVDSTVLPSIAEELYGIKDPAKQSELAHLIAQRHLSLRRVRELIDRASQNDYDCEISSQYQDREDRIRRIERAFDKSITALKITLDRMSMIIGAIEDDDWAITQILLEHKNMINNQINILLKEKRKYNFVRMTST